MDENTSLIAGMSLIVIGAALIKMRDGAGQKAAAIYKRFGIDVSGATYTKQFLYVGVLFLVLGFLTATGLLAIM